MVCPLPAGTHIPRVVLNWQVQEQASNSELKVSSVVADGRLENISDNLVVSGWAITRGATSPPVIQLLVDGHAVASGIPDITRPDLITANMTKSRAGFQLAIPPASLRRLTSTVEVVVEGHSLPRTVENLDLTANVSAEIKCVRNGKLELHVLGWPGSLPAVSLSIDSVHALTVDGTDASAGRFVQKGDISVIECNLPSWVNDAQLHTYCASLRFGDEALLTDTVLLRSPDYELFIDDATLRSLTGWALRKDSEKPLQISVYHGKALLAKTVASIARPDVQAAHSLSHPNVGFSVQLPAVSPAQWHATYEICDLNTGILLAKVGVAHKFDLLRNAAADLPMLKGEDATAARAVFAGMLISLSDELGFEAQLLPAVGNDQKPEEVAVVIPVYGGATATAECIESVLEASNTAPVQFVIVNDCSPDPLIVNYLHAVAGRKRPNVTVVHRKFNGGFSHSVNIGMTIAGRRDVILLNADTVVQDGWVDRLVRAANADSRIATVTPFSNNGEIASLPYICQSLPVNTSALARRIDAAADRVNPGVVVDMPVAIGFCMLIRRACIDEIGLFDAATWGRGYGEEVDFCLKASARGWRHVLTTDTFVVHRGNVSFGNEKLERILESSKKISAKFPFYDSVIQRFLAHDPVRPGRRTLNLELIRQTLPKRRILHLTHTYGGGTEQYVQDIAALGIEEGVWPVYLRLNSTGRAELSLDVSDSELVGLFKETHTEAFESDEIVDLKNAIDSFQFERMHIHSPFGASSELLDWLCSRITYDVTIHDYAWICPRVNLTYPGGVFCREPDVADCNRCVARYGAHPGLQGLLSEFDESVSSYREYFLKILSSAADVYAGSTDVSRRLHAHGVKRLIKAGPHPAPVDSPFAMIRTARPADAHPTGVTNIAVFGAISDIKGYALLQSCVKVAASRQLPLKFFVFGYTMDDSVFEGLTNISILGKYEDQDLESLVDEIGPHVSLFLHQWPETYSYTLSHSQRLGIWPITLDLGAPAERVRATKFGTVVSIEGMTQAELTDALLACASRIHSSPKNTKLQQVPTTLAAYRTTKAV